MKECPLHDTCPVSWKSEWGASWEDSCLTYEEAMELDDDD